MSDNLKSNLTSSKHWLRFLYMALFALILYVAMMVTWLLVVVQFFFALVTGNDNQALRGVCDSLSTYIYQIIRFLTYNTEEKPFPFSDWPEPETDELPEEDELEEDELIIDLVDEGEEAKVGDDSSAEVEVSAVDSSDAQAHSESGDEAANDTPKPEAGTSENAAGETAENMNDNDNPGAEKKDV